MKTLLDLSHQLDLLRQGEIVHPTRIAVVETGHRRLGITVVGYPWWQSTRSSDEGEIIFSFGGVEGLVDVETLLDTEYDEALEPFRVSPLADEEWDTNKTSYETYCAAPLPEPLRLYALIEDYLWSTGAPRSARDY